MVIRMMVESGFVSIKFPAPESVVPIHDKRRYLKPEVPPLNLVVETFICHIQSPREFYVHFNASK